MLLYQEIIQFAQHYCRTWGIQIAGNNSFQVFCFRLMDSLAVGQIYYMIQNALEYLYKQNALKARNENFINTNLLKKIYDTTIFSIEIISILRDLIASFRFSLYSNTILLIAVLLYPGVLLIAIGLSSRLCKYFSIFFWVLDQL